MNKCKETQPQCLSFFIGVVSGHKYKYTYKYTYTYTYTYIYGIIKYEIGFEI